jgi:hypothetical protein
MVTEENRLCKLTYLAFSRKAALHIPAQEMMSSAVEFFSLLM